MSQYTDNEHGKSLIQKESILEDIRAWEEDDESKMIFLFAYFKLYFKKFNYEYFKRILDDNENRENKISAYKNAIKEIKDAYINEIKEL